MNHRLEAEMEFTALGAATAVYKLEGMDSKDLGWGAFAVISSGVTPLEIIN